MMKKGFAVVVALVFVALLAFRSHAVPPVSDSQRESQDRQQIEKLMWQYTRALDSENADAYAAVYTSDGQFGTGDKAVKGHDALKKMISDLHQRAADNEAKGQKTPPMYHMEMNTYIEIVDKDHAKVEGYWQTVFGAQGQGTPVRVAAAGREVNDLVRVNGQWLIQTRDVAPKD
jgi:hypothetical protein